MSAGSPTLEAIEHAKAQIEIMDRVLADVFALLDRIAQARQAAVFAKEALCEAAQEVGT
jgi:hypothetical protein